MEESPNTAAEDTGPGAAILPTLHAVHKLMAEGLEAVGLKGYFTLVCLLPEVSDKEGFDVVRMASNLPPEEINGFLHHIARVTDDKLPNPGVQVLSLQQAQRLIAMLQDPQAVIDELKKRAREVH